MTIFCEEYDTWLDKLNEASINEREGELTTPSLATSTPHMNGSTQDKGNTMITYLFYTVGANDEYSLQSVRTDTYTASISKHFVCGDCVEAILAYEIDGCIHAETFGANDRVRPGAWKLCHAVDLAERYIKELEKVSA
jgi:hypothetical protein